MRRIFLCLTLLFSAPIFAQTPPGSKPPELVPLDDSLEPQVTIIKREGETVEEYRANGRLYKIKVIPENGIPYILIDHRGDGVFAPPADAPGTPGLSVPMWVIGTF